MTYKIRMGLPETEALWNSLRTKCKDGTATKNEMLLYKNGATR